jgi:hypothetical protein
MALHQGSQFKWFLLTAAYAGTAVWALLPDIC